MKVTLGSVEDQQPSQHQGKMMLFFILWTETIPCIDLFIAASTAYDLAPEQKSSRQGVDA